VLVLSAPAFAGDGRIEINQASAQAGAVTGSLADDPPGFPVRITRSGSYRLAGDLTVSDVAAGGILIAPGTDDVTIDLGGFAIRGPSATAGEPANACGPQGAGIGIRALPSAGPPTARNVVVRDGRVSGFGNTGIDLSGDGSRVEGVQAIENCGIGIALGDHAVLDTSQAIRNRFNGLHCGVACRVVGSAAHGNGEQGIRLLSDSIVHDSRSSDNGGPEVRGFETTLAVDLVVYDALDASVLLEDGSLALGIVVRGGADATLSAGDLDGAFGTSVVSGPFSYLIGVPLDCVLHAGLPAYCP
jgi:hypothetical protein